MIYFPSDPGEVNQTFCLLTQWQETRRIHVNVLHSEYPLAIENRKKAGQIDNCLSKQIQNEKKATDKK